MWSECLECCLLRIGGYDRAGPEDADVGTWGYRTVSGSYVLNGGCYLKLLSKELRE